MPVVREPPIAATDLMGRFRYTHPAPKLKAGVCSECGVAPVMCGDDRDLVVCPKCYAVLWAKRSEPMIKRQHVPSAGQQYDLHVRAYRLRAYRATSQVPSS